MRQLFGILTIAVIAAAGWIASKNPPPPPQVDEQFTASTATEQRNVRDEPVDAADPRDPSSQQETAAVLTPAVDFDSGLVEFVQWKYSYLATDRSVMEREALRRALLSREQLAVAVNTAAQAQDAAAKANLPALRAQLLEADEQVRQLLHPESYAQYLLLKDADAELHRLREYAGGISNVAPLLPEQERALLFAKLTYKQHFDQLLQESGLQGNDLPTPQRLDAYRTLAQAMETYRNNFLLQARQSLHSEAQYQLLRNYESTEFEAQLAGLHRSALGE